MRHVTTSERRRLLVDRHQLGATGRATRAIDQVTEAFGLLHSTDPATPFLMLQARTDASVRDVESMYYEARSVLRHTTIRRTVFTMPLDAVPLAHGAFNVDLVAKLRKQLVKWIDAGDEVSGSADTFLADTEAAVLAVLGGGPQTGNELAAAVPALQVRIDPAPGKAYAKPIRLTSKVLEILAAQGSICRGRPTGADFTSGAWRWEATSSWAPQDLFDVPSMQVALAGLLDRYLTICGPATLTDMTWWTGLTKTKVRAALGALGAEEVTLQDCDEPGYVRIGDELDAPEFDGSVALLPGLDSTTMAWKQRSWYVDDHKDTGIFDRNGNAGPTIWVDGRVVGVWSQRADGEIATHLVTDVEATTQNATATNAIAPNATTQNAIAQEAERIASFLGDVRVNWRFPTPLTKQLTTNPHL